jgi:MFS family permease
LKVSNESANVVLERFGRFRISQASTIQFNSIIFRIVAGVINPSLGSYVALLTAVEFVLNGLLEVPLGRVADTYGRARSAIAGFILLSLSLIVDFVYVQGEWDSTFNIGLAVTAGIFLGVGKPLISGSVEGFYQNILQRFSGATAEAEDLVSNSFVNSLNRRTYLPSLYILTSFSCVLAFSYFEITNYLFIVGAFLYLHLAIVLIFDLTRYPETRQQGLRFDFFVHGKNLFENSDATAGVIGLTFSVFVLMILKGYQIFFIAHEFKLSHSRVIMIYFFLMMGSMGLGWFLRARYGKTIATRLPYFPLFARLSMLLLVGVLIQSVGFLYPKVEILCITFFLSAAVVQFATGIVQDTSANLILGAVDQEGMSFALSIANIPGFFVVAIYSFWLSSYAGGYIASMTSAMQLVGGVFVFLMCLLLNKIRCSAK